MNESEKNEQAAPERTSATHVTDAWYRTVSALLDASSDALAVLDDTGKITLFNAGAERLTGVARARALGRSLFEEVLVLEEAGESAADPLRETLARGRFVGEVVARAPSGPTRVQLTAELRTQDDDTRAILVVVTGSAAAMDAAPKGIEGMGALARGIAHDLNNVLAPIVMSIDLMRCGPLTPELEETLETIEGAANRGAEMVRQVLSFARGVEGDGDARASEAERDAQRARESLPRGEGQTVLVVDDEPSVRRITEQTLEAFGYRALTASDGADAIATFARNEAEIAVVLTDISMPIMDGATTIQALLRIDPDVKIIAVSGVERPGGVIATQPGVKRFLSKPFSAATLLNALAEVLVTSYADD